MNKEELEMAGIENIDTEAFLKEGNQLITDNKFEEGIALIEQALQGAIKNLGSELDYSLVKYYYSYGDALIAKMANSDDIFGDAVQQAIEKKEEALADANAQKEKSLDQESKEEEKGDPQEEIKEPAQEEPTDDLEFAWDNMETARVITEKRRNETEKGTEEYNEATRQASRIYMRIGEILSMQEKVPEALEEFKKALDCRLECETEISRELAETYFTMGATILQIKGKEKEAIEYLRNSSRILENNLYSQLGKPVPTEESKEMFNTELVQSSIFDSKEIGDLKEVLKSVYSKIEDAILQEKELPELTQTLKEDTKQPQDQFDKQQFPVDQVVNLGVIKGKKRANAENADSQQEETKHKKID